MVPVVDHHK